MTSFYQEDIGQHLSRTLKNKFNMYSYKMEKEAHPWFPFQKPFQSCVQQLTNIYRNQMNGWETYKEVSDTWFDRFEKDSSH